MAGDVSEDPDDEDAGAYCLSPDALADLQERDGSAHLLFEREGGW